MKQANQTPSLLTSNFAHSSCAAKTVKPQTKRLAPLSLRLSRQERAQLEDEANGAPLGTYIKGKLFGKRKSSRQYITQKDKALAKALHRLGRAGLSNYLARQQTAVQEGRLFLDDAEQQELQELRNHVVCIRHDLMTALGLREE